MLLDQALSAVLGRVYIMSIRGLCATDAEALVVMGGVERVFVGE
jgi:Fe-S cluster assembly scaffold protein SufB